MSRQGMLRTFSLFLLLQEDYSITLEDVEVAMKVVFQSFLIASGLPPLNNATTRPAVL